MLYSVKFYKYQKCALNAINKNPEKYRDTIVIEYIFDKKYYRITEKQGKKF
jgi:hypothetical protein